VGWYELVPLGGSEREEKRENKKMAYWSKSMMKIAVIPMVIIFAAFKCYG
jgi:hypothetical protein